MLWRVDRKCLAWALYDWGNSAYATTVMAGLFPVFFADYWHEEAGPEAEFRLGTANSIAGILVALSAPFLGAIADRFGHRKLFLLVFTLLGASMTAALPLTGRGEWGAAAALYVVATFGFSGSLTFYDAMLKGVAPPDRADQVSALGYAAGYLGGGILFLVNVLMVTYPTVFGLADATVAVKVSFLSVAIWWVAFAIPLFRVVPESRPANATSLTAAVRAGWLEILDTLRALRRFKQVFLFLVGYWLYIDGVDTIVRMATFYGRSLEFPTESLIFALLITQFVGFPATLAFGAFGARIGARRGILVALSVYVVVTVWGVFMEHVWEFYALAIIIGLVQGGVQALSRSFFLRLIPDDKAAQFFGFYNMLGKFAVAFGPFLMGVVAHVTDSTRASLLVVVVLLVIGGGVLTRVKEPGRDGPGRARFYPD